ncbi:nuA3 HAT complex component nto1 [Actinomortierella wolfii]|nr:nuA3 HAT complex component nto1 [Actinomortierella wolfii]
MAPSGRPRGRPPRAGRAESSSHRRKTSLDTILDAYNEEVQPVPKKETHPISQKNQVTHEYPMDDDHKPREERSYLEFFPFLDPTVRLTIVADTSKSKSIEVAPPQHAPSAQQEAQPYPAQAPSLPAIKEESHDHEHNHNHGQDQKKKHKQDEKSPDSTASNDQAAGAVTSTPEQPPVSGQEVTKNLSTSASVNVVSDATSNSEQEQEEFFDASGSMRSTNGSAEPSTIAKDGSQANGNHSVAKTSPLESSSTPGASSSGDSKGTSDESSRMEIDQIGTTVDVSATENKDKEMNEQATSHTTESGTGAAQASQNAVTNNNSTTIHEPHKAAESVQVLSSGAEPPLVKIAHQHPLSSMVLEPKTPVSSLPKSTFRKIPRERDDVEVFHMPNHYMRYIEPTEMDLADRVEYDMDEHDMFWLQALNEERRKDDLVEVSAITFEKIIDRLEKEWFDLTKNIPKTQENLPPEDSACNICDDGECENSNAIVFCDGCNLAVHQDCYGIPYIPEGQWLCRKCMLSPQMPVSCIFCPGEGGAFKQTTNNRWAHLLCANWIPEVGVANTVYMEPIDNIDKIPASRWRLTCYICKLRVGACIQCETKNCFRAFHVTCARKAHLYMKSRLSRLPGGSGEVLTYRAHCHKHTPRDYKDRIDIAGAAALFANRTIKKRKKKHDGDSDDPDYGLSEDEEMGSPKGRRKGSVDSNASSHTAATSSQVQGSRTSKAALAHQKHYTPGAPLAPSYIVQRLIPYCAKLGGKTHAARKKYRFLYTICKYWSLKRESRRGAPLLKRLHLEPWTASASAHRQTEEEKMKKLQTLLTLRGDLEKVRMLAELVRKRERAKLKRQEYQNRYLSLIFFPLKSLLEDTLSELEKLDRQKYFHYPISEEEVKDYHEIIKNPISFQDMREKLENFQYNDVDSFAEDARRIYENCMTYNQVDTTYYRAAARQAKTAEALLEKARESYAAMDVDPVSGFLKTPIDPEIFSYTLDPFPAAGESGDVDGEDADGGSALGTETATPESGTPAPDVNMKRSHKKKPKEGASADSSQPAGSRSLRNTRSGGPSITSTTTASSSSLKSGEKRSADKKSKSPSSKASTPLAINTTTTSTTAPASSSSSSSSKGSSIGADDGTIKVKPHTMTRSEAARAREQHLQIENEEELLEKLKKRSEKSRKVAANLQSRLKPSIVDKAVVINKPAPKGWAYVVVEGEDSDEGEEEESYEDVQVKKEEPKPKPPAPKRPAPTASATSTSNASANGDGATPKAPRRHRLSKTERLARQKAANLRRKQKYWEEKNARLAAMAQAQAAEKKENGDQNLNALSSGTSNMETLAAVAEAVARAEMPDATVDYKPEQTTEVESMVKTEPATGSNAAQDAVLSSPAVAQADSDTEMADVIQDEDQQETPTEDASKVVAADDDEENEEENVKDEDEEEKASDDDVEEQEDQDAEADSDDAQEGAPESDHENESDAEESEAEAGDEDQVQADDDEEEEEEEGEEDADEDDAIEAEEEEEDDDDDEAAADSDEAQDDAEESDQASASDELEVADAQSEDENAAEESDDDAEAEDDDDDEEDDDGGDAATSNDEAEDEGEVKQEDSVHPSDDDDGDSHTSGSEYGHKELEDDDTHPPPAKRQKRLSDKSASSIDATSAPATNGRRRLRSSDHVTTGAGSPPEDDSINVTHSKGGGKVKKGKGTSPVSSSTSQPTMKNSKRRRSMS